MPTFRNTCPRHCYSSCSMISHINGGKLTKVVGDPDHGYTKGRLCAKGYALIQYALDEHRLKYPLQQMQRGSGVWRRISWNQAYEIIANKVLELNNRYGSNLGLGYYKGKGNTGFLHQAVEGMFAGLGPHTHPIGDICSATGETALRETLGGLNNPDPEEMSNAGLIVIWGANPASTNINQMKFIRKACQKGAPLVVVDSIFTRTAARADLYIQINPGTDAWLAWGICKILIENDQYNKKFIQEKTKGFEQYRQEIKKITFDEIYLQTGVQLPVIKKLVELYTRFHPVANWLGFGLQRYLHGGESVKSITALTSLTKGSEPGGGIYFYHQPQERFPQCLAKHEGVKHPTIPSSRKIPVNNYPGYALGLQDPPLKMLWISCGNPLAQDYNLKVWRELLKQMELVVTVDLYLNSTAQQSDLVLPTTSFFEEEDLHLSFWHHWLSYNQKALPNFYEARSDLQIARELTNKLNELKSDFSNFPAGREPWDWIMAELSSEIMELYGFKNPIDLKKRSYKKKKEASDSNWQYNFSIPQAHLLSQRVDSAIEILLPYRLLTPQSLLKFHTQYENLSWLNPENSEEPIIKLSEKIVHRHSIHEDSLIEVYNENGFIKGRAKTSPHLPGDVILIEQSDHYPVNNLINTQAKDEESIPYFDCRVNVRRARKSV